MPDKTRGSRVPATIPPGLTDTLSQYNQVGRNAYDIFIWIVLQINSSGSQPFFVTKQALLSYFGWLTEDQIRNAIRLLQTLGHIRFVQDLETENGYILLTDVSAPIHEGESQ